MPEVSIEGNPWKFALQVDGVFFPIDRIVQHAIDIIRDYAAVLPTAVKNWFWEPLSEFNPEKAPLFVTNLSCAGQDSTNFYDNLIFKDFFMPHLLKQIMRGSATYELLAITTR